MIKKIILTILVIIGLFTVIIISLSVRLISSVKDDLTESSSTMVAQIEEKVTFEYRTDMDYKTCDFRTDVPDSIKNRIDYVRSYSCVGKKCTFSAKEEMIANHDTLLIRGKISNGSCGTYEIPAKSFTKTVEFIGKIKVGSEYLKNKGVDVESASLDTIFPNKNTKYGIIKSKGHMMSTYYANISYGQKPTSDTINIAGQNEQVLY